MLKNQKVVTDFQVRKRKFTKFDTQKPDPKRQKPNKTLSQTDTASYDTVCKEAWRNAFFCIHSQDKRLPDELRDQLIEYMTNIHGHRSAV